VRGTLAGLSGLTSMVWPPDETITSPMTVEPLSTPPLWMISAALLDGPTRRAACPQFA
jgi:hypothetical protein